MIDKLTEKYATIIDDSNDENLTRSYRNSPAGRYKLVAEQPPDIVSEVMEMWGDTSTVLDLVPEPPHELSISQPTPEQLAIAQLAREVAALKGGATNV